MVDKFTKPSEDKSINIKLNVNLYNKVKILATILDANSEDKIQINDLMNEGMKLILEKHKDVIQQELESMLSQ